MYVDVSDLLEEAVSDIRKEEETCVKKTGKLLIALETKKLIEEFKKVKNIEN